MEKILRELLSEDKTILIRRDDLLAALEKKTPDNLIRDLNTMRRAVNLNLGELFYNGETQRQATQDKAREILKSSGLQDIRVDFVIDTFKKALGWDKNPPVNLEKTSDSKDETAPPSQQNQRNLENALKKLNQQKDELAEKSRLLNLMEERLNKREVELKLREQKLERKESAGKNNSSTPKSTEPTPPIIVAHEYSSRPAPKSTDEKKKTTEPTPPIIVAHGYSSRPAPKPSTAVAPISAETVTADYSKLSTDKFISKYNAIKLKFNSSTPLSFEKVDYALAAFYLAVKVQDDKFLFFPNTTYYSDFDHTEQAMSTVFNSNFVSGQDYRKITVEQPALFEYKNNSWELLTKGKLRLENPPPVNQNEPQQPEKEQTASSTSPAPKSTDEKKKTIETPKPSINVAHEYSSRPAPKPSTAVAPISAETVTADYSKLSTDKFISKYNAIKLKFNSSTPLSFEKVDYALAAYYLAVKVQDDKFLFFPNTTYYSDFDHTEQAMSTVFDSNFVSGQDYRKITVEQPAVFELQNNSWDLLTKGKLRLENPPPVNQNEPQQPEKEQTASSTFWTDFKKNFLTTEGRLNRWAYFVFELKLIGIFIVGMILSGILIGIPILILGIIGNLSVTIRRLHDLDKSGWWILPMFIPYVGWLFILYIFFAKGTSGNNSYGADPLAKLN